jgi:hypothetical protein
VTSAIIVRSSRLRIAVGGGVGRPQLRELARELLELLAWGLGRGLGLLGELGFCLGELAQLLLPAGFEVSGDEAVVGLAGVERALGTDRVIAGALDAQLRGAGGARAAVGDRVGGGERELELLGRERREQPAGDEFVDDGRVDRAAAGRRDVVGA